MLANAYARPKNRWGSREPAREMIVARTRSKKANETNGMRETRRLEEMRLHKRIIGNIGGKRDVQ